MPLIWSVQVLLITDMMMKVVIGWITLLGYFYNIYIWPKFRHHCACGCPSAPNSAGTSAGTMLDEELTHWGWVTHICVSKLTIIGSDNGLSPGRRQAIIWTNAGILLIRTLGTNFSEISIGILTFSFKKMHLKMLSAKWRPFCPGLNVLSMFTFQFL